MDLLTHLHSRGLYPHRYRSVHLDDASGVVSFYLWNLSGQLVGYQQYRPEGDKKQCNDREVGKYYTYQKDSIALWGLETLEYRSDVLFITEGVFDAVKFHTLNLPAVAVLQNNPKPTRTWLYALPRIVIAACDNDAAGRKLASSAQYAIFPPEAGQDFGDMPIIEIERLIYKELPWIKF
jgi:hypothetical protein